MAPKTRKDMRSEAAKKRRKQIDDLKRQNKSVREKRKQDLKIKNLSRNLYETDSKGRLKRKKKSLSNIPVQERSAPVNKKARGLATLGSDYRKQEESLSKKATKRSAEINKARYPKMGTYKNEKGESAAEEKENKKSTSTKKYGNAPKGYIKSKGKFVSLKTNKGKQLAKLEERKKKLKIKRFG